MTEADLIAVEPWPMYRETGGKPVWRVRVETSKNRVWLYWLSEIGRFSKTKSTMSIRRGSPAAYRSAVGFMSTFCASYSRDTK